MLYFLTGLEGLEFNEFISCSDGHGEGKGYSPEGGDGGDLDVGDGHGNDDGQCKSDGEFLSMLLGFLGSVVF